MTSPLSGEHKMECDICWKDNGKLPKLTHWYYNDDKFVIADCKTCGPNKPVIFYYQHGVEPSNPEIYKINEVIHDIFGSYKFRASRGKNKNHWHYHILRDNKK